VTISKHQLYSIKDLENFTQIKAHTIRVWEQRYNLLNPKRTESNIRFYDDGDLKKLLNIKLLYTNGFKISKIASLSEDEIIAEAKRLIQETGSEAQDKWTNDLLLLILDFNAEKIKSLLRKELKKSDLMSLYVNRIIPLLKMLGELWQVNSIGIVHEHFFSNIYREFIISQIDSIKPNKNGIPKAVLFLHSEEEHEFSILMYYYILKKEGYTCYYFGQKTPTLEIEEIQELLKPDLVVTTFTSKITEKSFKRIMNVLSRISELSKVIISGNQLKKMDLSLPKNIHFIETTEELDKLTAIAHSN